MIFFMGVSPGLCSVLIVDCLSNGAGAKKIVSERKFVGAGSRFHANKPPGTDQLSQWLGKHPVQAAMLVSTPVGPIEDLSGNFEFHRGHINPNLRPVQQTEKNL
jgi:hypothetical protein